jgi:hypothetical protein
MKPNPFVSLKNLTVPLFIILLNWYFRKGMFIFELVALFFTLY